jgi:cell division ATP-binding protein FtsE
MTTGRAMAQEQRIIVGVYHLSKSFGRHFSLQDINLQVANGEFVFLVGPSGAGKSTLLRMIYMDDTPTSGQVVVGPHVSTRMKRGTIPELRRKIGIVFQDFRLLEDQTVFENVALALKVTGVGMGEVKRQVTEILMRVGLYHKRYDFPAELSGGEQQRIAIARAVVNHPAILLADEPTGNLDTENSTAVLELLRDLNARLGQTILMITHNPDAAAYGHHTVHMRDGKVVERT